MPVAEVKLTDAEEKFFDAGGEDTAVVAEPVADKDGDAKPAGVKEDLITVTDAAAKGKDDKPKEGDKPTEEKQIVHNKAALDAERNRRKQVEREREKERREAAERFARLDERLNILQEARKPKGDEPEIDLGPDLTGENPDYIGWISWRQNKDREEARERLRTKAAEEERNRSQTQESRQRDDFTRDLALANQEWDAAATENPELPQILEGVRESYGRELYAHGWRGQQLMQKLNEMEASYAVSAYRNQIPIEQYIMNIAQARNVQLKASVQQQQPEAARPNGHDKSAEDEVKRLTAAKDASVSLSQGGGTAGGGKITLEALDRMTKDEFDAFAAKVNKDDPHGMDKLTKRLTFGG